MSQRNRLVVAAIALTMVFALALPAPSHAAGLHPGHLPALSTWDRAWNWLAALLPGGIAPQSRDRQEKEGSMVSPDGNSGLTFPSGPPQGSMIDPDGIV